MPRDSQNKSKVISHFSQIINTTKKEYQSAAKEIKELTEENMQLKKDFKKYKYYRYRDDIKNQKEKMRKKN